MYYTGITLSSVPISEDALTMLQEKIKTFSEVNLKSWEEKEKNIFNIEFSFPKNKNVEFAFVVELLFLGRYLECLGNGNVLFSAEHW